MATELAIVAVDPGKDTGVAVYYVEEGKFSSWEMPCWEAVAVIENWLDHLFVGHLIVEGFTINAQSAKLSRGEEHWPLESLGALRYMATRQHDVPFTVQPRTDKKFGTDFKLRQLGWYAPSAGGHKNDAARHLLKFLADQKLLTPAQLAQFEEGDDG